jgi:hypothetical protein
MCKIEAFIKAQDKLLHGNSYAELVVTEIIQGVCTIEQLKKDFEEFVAESGNA